jgi:hypothetical protein
MRIGVTADVGGDPERVRYPIVRLVAWLSDELARRFMRNSLVPQRRTQVRYVTVTKMRGYSCTAEVPVVSVSAVVEDFPHGSVCHIPTATTRRNRARARLESEPHDLGELPLSRLRGISPGSDNSHVFPDYSQLFADRTLLAERLSTSTLEHIAQQLMSLITAIMFNSGALRCALTALVNTRYVNVTF